MNKILAAIAAGSLIFAVSGPTWSADNKDSQNSPQATPGPKPQSEAANKSNKPDEQKAKESAAADLKKCDAMTDPAQKDKCVKDAHKAHGKM